MKQPWKKEYECLKDIRIHFASIKSKELPSQYKKIRREKDWGMQIEDYEILADDKQIKKYCESSQAQEAFSIFRELRIKEKKLSQNECCTVRDYLFVIKRQETVTIQVFA